MKDNDKRYLILKNDNWGLIFNNLDDAITNIKMTYDSSIKYKIGVLNNTDDIIHILTPIITHNITIQY